MQHHNAPENVNSQNETVEECERLSVANLHAAAVMHEVNNPLEAITNLASLLKDERLTEQGRERLMMLEGQIVALTSLTRPSLAFYRDQKVSKQIGLGREAARKPPAECRNTAAPALAGYGAL